jgi:competence protein ComEC
VNKNMNENRLFGSFKELFIFIFVLLSIFFINLFLQWQTYKDITSYPYCKTKAEIKSVNIRDKNGSLYSSMEFQSVDGYRFYSAKHIDTTRFEGKNVEVVFDSSKVTFVDFLRGFRAKTFDVTPLPTQKRTIQKFFKDFIADQHSDERLKKLFVSLFFETRLPDDLQQKINEFGLSAVMSLSGLNLTLLVGLIFFVLNKPYRFMQDRYFPYRNRNFDILFFALILMFFYAYLADFSKPFSRALVMAIIAFILSARGVKIINFTTLFVTILVLIALSPSAFFSIGLWLSVAGVYYIFLFLRQTSGLDARQSYILLALFVFLAMSVVARYLFPVFTMAQLSSPITSVLFDFFYPVEVVLHIFGLGWMFDFVLLEGLELTTSSIDLYTPAWFFYIFIALSVGAYFKKEAFWLLNICATLFMVASIAVALV